MKRLFSGLKMMNLVAICIALFSTQAHATVYTALLSGNFNAAATWGGIIPGGLLTSDVVVIPAGINVTLNTVQTISGSTAMTVNGILSSGGAGTALIMTGGTLSGTGTISVDSAALGMTTGFGFTGTLTANRFTSTGATLSSAANVTVYNSLYLAGGALNVAAGNFTMGSMSDIILSGGTINTSGSGMLHLTNPYNVTYTTLSAGTGSELNGSGLTNLTVNAAASTVTMTTSAMANGMITLTAGTLAIGSNTLTLGTAGGFAATGTGAIMGGATSDLVINSTASLTGALRFAAGGNTLRNLTLNMGSAANAAIANDLTVDGMLTLTAGALSLNGHNLVLNTGSDVAASGTGTIMGNVLSNLTVNSTAGLTGMLRFAAGGGVLNNLTINTGTTGNVSLGSDLALNGMTTLTAGTLALNGHTLTINTTGDIAASGTGTIMGSATSNLVVNSTAGLSGTLRFATGGNVLHNITVNTGTGGNVSLSSDLMLDGTASLSAGALSLNGHTLTLSTTSDIAAAGTGSIMGSATSNLVINSTTSLTGMLRFTAGSNTLHNLTVAMGSGAASTSLGSDLNINGTLTLTTGRIIAGSSNINLLAGAAISGGSAASYVVTNGTGRLAMNLAAGATGTFEVGTAANFAPMAITANSGATTGDVSINVADGILADGTTGTSLSATHAVVNATWFVASTASTMNYNMTAMWNAGMELNAFDRTNAYISHYTGGAWDVQTGTAAGTSGSLYTMSRTGITSFSPFSVMQAGTSAASNITLVQPEIAVYPNPATSVLSFTSNATIQSVSIYDMSGRNVTTTGASTSSVNIQDLPTGTYFIHLLGKDMDVVREFVKQ